jgi:hypothetical protein
MNSTHLCFSSHSALSFGTISSVRWEVIYTMHVRFLNFLLDWLLCVGFVLFGHVHVGGFFDCPEDLLWAHVQHLCTWGLVIRSGRRREWWQH